MASARDIITCAAFFSFLAPNSLIFVFKMSACAYWNSKYHADRAMFECPWCQRDLKSKLSTSAKNPNRAFVSCNKDFGGCGLFSFLDDQPNESFNPNNKRGGGVGAKRPRSEGTNIVGPVANAPGVHEERLAELVTEMAALKTLVTEAHQDLSRKIAEVRDSLV